MTFEWETQWFSDLSGVFMVCAGDGYELVTQFDNVFGHYSVWVKFDSAEDPCARVFASTPQEACDIGESIVEQWVIDRTTSLLQTVGL
jgi:hypothetical protein